jgi:hypothetical protein
MPIGARKYSQFIAVCVVPDVCKTPVGKDLVPLPYQIMATLEDSKAVSGNVNFNGEPVFLLEHSAIPSVTGNEPGSGGGTKSGVNKGKVRATSASQSVLVNGRKVVRHDDECEMNLSG